MSGDVIIMAAPNGARKTKSDHQSIPLSIGETAAEAAACQAAGASVLHAHVRGQENEHVLDEGLYRELLNELSIKAPDMLIQITSEAVGRYSPDQQVACIKAVKPHMASVALREITSDFNNPEYAQRFYEWCNEAEIHIQHIVFSREELNQWLAYRDDGLIPSDHRCLLFVLGRYKVDFQSDLSDLEPFLQADLANLDWFTCAFGRLEQKCVLAGIESGGHARVGFENNLYLPDGSIASSTAALIESLCNQLKENHKNPASAETTRQRLGIRSP